jgi:hypothetical protein
MGTQSSRFLESKYAFLVVVAIFVFVLLVLTMIYFKSGPAGREIITKGMTLFGNAIMILNLLILIYTKLLERIKEQKDQVGKINDFSMTAINTIFSQFYKEKDNLGALYGEIFEDKIDAKKPVELDYYETNFLFIVFQIIHNVYRSYYISGADTNKYDVSQYDSWENLILQIVKSPKVQLFYKRYSHLFVSLGFNDYIEKQYFNRVPRYIDINVGLPKTV